MEISPRLSIHPDYSAQFLRLQENRDVTISTHSSPVREIFATNDSAQAPFVYQEEWSFFVFSVEKSKTQGDLKLIGRITY